MRAALKAVRLTPEGTVVQEVASDVPSPPRHVGPAGDGRIARRARRGADRRARGLRRPAAANQSGTGTPNARTTPRPCYIPQAEYAQMLRDQAAAEKAAVAAAAELRRLAEVEELDELAVKEEFSDWTT